MYYKNGFYAEPQDGAVELTDAQYEALIIGQSQGKQIVQGKDGVPVAVEPQPSEYHQWNGESWEISQEKQTALLAAQRDQVRAKINTLRDAKTNGGIYVEALGKWIDTDATAERNILSVKASFDLFGDMEIAWTCADNSVLTINKEKLMLIWQALMAAKTGNHDNAMRHKTALEQAKSPLKYDYSDGWTTSYQDYLAEQDHE